MAARLGSGECEEKRKNYHEPVFLSDKNRRAIEAEATEKGLDIDPFTGRAKISTVIRVGKVYGASGLFADIVLRPGGTVKRFRLGGFPAEYMYEAD